VVTRTRQVITPAAAPTPAVPPRPHGDLDTATAEALSVLADAIWPRKRPRSWLHRRGLEWLLGYLAERPGLTWQERWLSSGLNDGTHRVRELKTGNPRVDPQPDGGLGGWG